MSWFFGRRKREEDDEDEYSSEGESYTSSEGEEYEEGGTETAKELDDPDSDGEAVQDDEQREDGKICKKQDATKPVLTDAETNGEASETHSILEGQQEENVSKSATGDDHVPQDEGTAISASSNKDVPAKAESKSDAVACCEAQSTTVDAMTSSRYSKTSGSLEPGNQETSLGGHNKERHNEEQQVTPIQPHDSNSKKANGVEEPEDDIVEENKTDEEVTSTHEKRSLLVLAAEHDRVDIMKAILSDECEDRYELLNYHVPPLHIALTCGSINTVQCLLRMGADPSVRPHIDTIKAEESENEQLVDIPNSTQFDGRSAWELAFGSSEGTEAEHTQSKTRSSWFGGGNMSQKKSLNIAPSKLEGIRHAFTAEALRCIGSDEVDRLKQLLDSGMPSTVDIGGKDLYHWAIEMSSSKCQELLYVEENEKEPNECNENRADQSSFETAQRNGKATAVLQRSQSGDDSIPKLINRIDELDSLSKALSICLDNLAEEVSVCHGLLLMGGGASALASHVRSLKTLKEGKRAELEHMEEAWDKSQDELAYWLRQCGEQADDIAALVHPASTPNTETEPVPLAGTPTNEERQKHQLKAQAAALEDKVRKLRASIADLSEENTQDLEEVEKRGLSGGINLVRTLRDELREIEFALSETRNADALCQAKIQWICAKIEKHQDEEQGPQLSDIVKGQTLLRTETEKEDTQPIETYPRPRMERKDLSYKGEPPSSKSIPSSKAIVTSRHNQNALRQEGTPSYFTIELWKILLRIIGMNPARTTTASNPNSNGSSSNVMIV